MKLANVSLLVSFIVSASALHIPFERRASPIKRDPYSFENINDLLYAGTIYVDGQPFLVQLDTGSSDLWIDTTGITFANAKNTSIVGGVGYLDGTSAIGPILISNVTFGNWTAPQQAFISAPGSNAANLGNKGLLGVGPPSLSAINGTLSNTSYNGASFLYNVFTAYPNDPDIITFLLSRTQNGITSGGNFTIGSIVPGYEAISQEPHLYIINSTSKPAVWKTAMDGVLVDGTFYSGNSKYLNGTSQLTAILDTGTSAAIMTKPYADVIYSSSPAAQWNANNSAYVFPCDTIYNVSFVFGKKEIFIHPIDLGAPYGIASNGVTVLCMGAPVNDKSGVDFLLGDSFLRNVYSLFNFGNWASDTNDIPYMQIAGITDPKQALSEFASLNAQRVSNFQSTTKNSTSNAISGAISNANSSSASSSPQTVDLSSVNRNSYIIMGMAGVAILLLLLNLVMGARSNKGYKQIGTPAHYGDAYSTPYDH